MVGKRRLTKQTLGIFMETGQAVPIPPGAVIQIPIAPDEGRRTVDVIWDGKEMMMFTSDLRDRSEEFLHLNGDSIG